MRASNRACRAAAGGLMQVAVIGNDEFVTGFRLAGVSHVFEAAKEIEKEIENALEKTGIGVLVIEEDAFNSLSGKTKKRLEKLVKPVVVTISDKGKETNLREMIKKSLGVDLWA